MLRETQDWRKLEKKKNIFGEDSGIENSFAQKRTTPIT